MLLTQLPKALELRSVTLDSGDNPVQGDNPFTDTIAPGTLQRHAKLQLGSLCQSSVAKRILLEAS